jgi:hypothetical protein
MQEDIELLTQSKYYYTQQGAEQMMREFQISYNNTEIFRIDQILSNIHNRLVGDLHEGQVLTQWLGLNPGNFMCSNTW